MKRVHGTIIFDDKEVHLVIPEALRVVHKEICATKTEYILKGEPYVTLRTVTDDIVLMECSPQKAKFIMELWEMEDKLFRNGRVKIVTDYL